MFAFFPFFWLAFNQMTTNVSLPMTALKQPADGRSSRAQLTSQAAVLDTHGLPNDIL